MNKDFNELAKILGLSESAIRKYRLIGLLDDLVEVVQDGKVKHLEISNDLRNRIKNIQKLKNEGYELKAIMHKLVPISIYELSIGNKSGTHRMERRIRFTLVVSDKIESVFFKNEPQEISEEEMKKIKDFLIETGDYKLAEKIKFTPNEFTFLFEEFEETIFESEYLKKQRMLRNIQDSMKPLQWYEQNDGKIIFNELYKNKVQFDNYNQCLNIYPIVKYVGVNKYAIRYNIGIRFLDNIQFSGEYAYLMDRLIKEFKKKMKEINISDIDDEFQSYTLANVVSEKESKLLNIIREEKYKTIEIIKKNGNKLTIKATKSQYNADFKKLLEIYKEKGYKKISVNQNDGETFFITEEDHYQV